MTFDNIKSLLELYRAILLTHIYTKLIKAATCYVYHFFLTDTTTANWNTMVSLRSLIGNIRILLAIESCVLFSVFICSHTLLLFKR